MNTQATVSQLSWDLSDLYQHPTDPELAGDREKLNQAVSLFCEAYSPQISEVLADSAQLASALKDYVKLQELSHNLQIFAELNWSVNTQSPELSAFRNQLARELNALQGQTEFFRQALSHLSPEQLERLLAAAELTDYRAFIHSAARFQPFLLPEAQEQLLQQFRPYSQQRWTDLYIQTTSHWRYQLQGQELGEDETYDYLRKADPELRWLGYQQVYQTYADHGQLISFIYNSLIQVHAQEARQRGFASTLAQQAFGQQINPEDVLAMQSQVHQHQHLFRRYYQELSRSLGMPLRSCDLTAPLRSQDWQVSWQQGQQLILGAIAPLGQELQTKAQAFFERRWIHAQPQKGKSGGAFCAPVANGHPYILMNWNDNYYSLTALAHELGHGLHFSETVAHQHLLNLMPPLFLAETASTLNEYLLGSYLVAESSNPADKRYFLAEMTQRFLNGLFRQAQITDFELFAHSQGAEGNVSLEALNQKWLELAQERAGDVLQVPELEAAGWSRVPHLFLYPFYCFNYTLSNLIVLALIHQYQDNRAEFLPRYLAFLQAGGALSPQELLRLLRLDLQDPGFYTQAFEVLEDLITQLETLEQGQSSGAGPNSSPQPHAIPNTPNLNERGE